MEFNQRRNASPGRRRPGVSSPPGPGSSVEHSSALASPAHACDRRNPLVRKDTGSGCVCSWAVLFASQFPCLLQGDCNIRPREALTGHMSRDVEPAAQGLAPRRCSVSRVAAVAALGQVEAGEPSPCHRHHPICLVLRCTWPFPSSSHGILPLPLGEAPMSPLETEARQGYVARAPP